MISRTRTTPPKKLARRYRGRFMQAVHRAVFWPLNQGMNGAARGFKNQIARTSWLGLADAAMPWAFLLGRGTCRAEPTALLRPNCTPLTDNGGCHSETLRAGGPGPGAHASRPRKEVIKEVIDLDLFNREAEIEHEEAVYLDAPRRRAAEALEGLRD
jgi:hypothetical protein